jgi:hypothetical protein
VSSQHNNGGGWPHDGGSPDDLPDLPEEWGVIVVPDDLSELDDEVRAIRAELRLPEHRTRGQRLADGLRRLASAGVRTPVLIISLAVLVTIASVFASAWPGPPRSPATQRTANHTDDRGDTLPALELIGPDGSTVALRGHLPAVVLVTDGCDCARLVADTTAAVRPEIAVVTVSTTEASRGTVPPTGATPHAQGKVVRQLSDPTGELRAHLDLGPADGTAAAVLVNRGGEVVRTYARIASVADLRADLARL